MSAAAARLLYSATLGAYVLWFLACPEGFARLARGHARRWARTVRAELGPFVLPLILVGYAGIVIYEHTIGRVEGFNWFAPGFLLVMVVNWWNCRRHRDDDDRWRRRRRKALTRIRVLAGRLVADPGGA